MKFKIALLFAIILIAGQAFSQTTIDDFYPKIKDIEADKDVKNHEPLFEVTGCVSGDCKNGKGIYIQTNLVKVSSISGGKSKLGYSKYDKSTVGIKIYEGDFSENGTKLNGKLHYLYIYFEKKDGNNKFKAVENSKFETLYEDNKKLQFEGDFVLADNKNYYKVKGFNRYSESHDKSIKSVYSWYIDGRERLTTIEYLPAVRNKYAKQTGRRNKDGEFIFSKIAYANGNEYIGFITDGKKMGTGIFKEKNKETLKGMWVNDSLVYDMDIDFPIAAYDGNVANSFTHSEIMIQDKLIKGQVDIDSRTGRTFFAADNGYLFYHGFTKNNKPEDLGFALNLLHATRKLGKSTYITQSAESGIFKDGWLANGTQLKIEFAPDEDGRLLAIREVDTRVGDFAKGKQSGCGTYQSDTREANRYLFEQGEFVNGKISGWHYKKDSSFISNFSGYTHPLFYEPYNTSTLENKKAYVAMLANLENTKPNKCDIGIPPNIKELVNEKRAIYARHLKYELKQIAKANEKKLAISKYSKIVNAMMDKQIKNGNTIVETDYADYDRQIMLVIISFSPMTYGEIDFQDLEKYTVVGPAYRTRACASCDGKGYQLSFYTTNYSLRSQGASHTVGNTTFTPVYKTTTYVKHAKRVPCKQCGGTGYKSVAK